MQIDLLYTLITCPSKQTLSIMQQRYTIDRKKRTGGNIYKYNNNTTMQHTERLIIDN
jgi:hypothetical protein